MKLRDGHFSDDGSATAAKSDQTAHEATSIRPIIYVLAMSETPHLMIIHKRDQKEAPLYRKEESH